MNSSRTLPQITKSYQFPLLNSCLVSFIFLDTLAQTQSFLGYIAIIALLLIYFLTFLSWSLSPCVIIRYTNWSHSLAADPCHVQNKDGYCFCILSYGYSHLIYQCFCPKSNCRSSNLACFLFSFFSLLRPLCLCAVTFAWNIMVFPAIVPAFHPILSMASC